MLLQGRTAVVSGVGPGLGRSIALALASEGASVAIAARNEAYLTELAAEITAIGSPVLARKSDITAVDDCLGLAAAAHEQFGRLDILVNNGHSHEGVGLFDDADLDVWRRAMEVNYWGSLKMTQAVVPYMKKLDDARVIMVNSMAMFRLFEGDGSYVGSKAALASATRFLAKDLGRFGIRVNAVHPGYMRQAKLDRYFEREAKTRGTSPEAVESEVLEASCLGYIPTCEDVAGAVVFLASPIARGITGQAIHVNAGTYLP